MKRYRIHPIADENCDSLNLDVRCASANNLAEAKKLAEEHSSHSYGAGILDTDTGAVDFGYGFGVPCPELIC